MKKSAKEILVKFCQLKSRYIAKIFNIQNDFYWNKYDTKWLRGLNEKTCEKILSILKENINNRRTFLLSSSTCIPCIYFYKIFELFFHRTHICKSCMYAKNHDRIECNYSSSDYEYIINLFKEDNLDEGNILSNKFYRKILKEASK